MKMPHEIVPTLSLAPTYSKRPSTTATYTYTETPLNTTIPTSTAAATTNASVSSSQMAKLGTAPNEFRALDEESRKRILDWIYENRDGGGGTVTRERASRDAELKRGTDGHAMSFYIPPVTKKEKASADLLDVWADRLKLTTKSNLLRIDKTLLIENGMTLRVLIDECRVKIKDLYFAGILTSFADLVQLGFTPEDLKRDRILFDCQTLRERFGATAELLERHGLTLNIVKEPPFYPQELIILEFPLGEHIEQGYVSRDALRQLDYAMADLVSLGFAWRHLKKLKITREMAQAQQPKGFGWTKADLDLLK